MTDDLELPTLSDADLLALSVIWEHRRQRQAAGIKILLLPFVPCPTCGATVDETIIGPQDLATFRQSVTMQPCGHHHTVSENTLLRLQEHVGEMLTNIEFADRRGEGTTVEAIIREARDRTTPDNPPASQDAADTATAQHHTVDGNLYLCHNDDHYCPNPPGSHRE